MRLTRYEFSLNNMQNGLFQVGDLLSIPIEERKTLKDRRAALPYVELEDRVYFYFTDKGLVKHDALVDQLCKLLEAIGAKIIKKEIEIDEQDENESDYIAYQDEDQIALYSEEPFI